MKCTICGEETRKGRQICIGCDAVKKVTKQGVNSDSGKLMAPEHIQERASSHLEKKPGLINISWNKLFQKNRKVII